MCDLDLTVVCGSKHVRRKKFLRSSNLSIVSIRAWRSNRWLLRKKVGCALDLFRARPLGVALRRYVPARTIRTGLDLALASKSNTTRSSFTPLNIILTPLKGLTP